ncbi:hypothetical protein Avbf_18730 [Armadillidium vulgare]|nr:hypothetical protein Avbf_18730 [Armadillidium vulgare]
MGRLITSIEKELMVIHLLILIVIDIRYGSDTNDICIKLRC